MGKIKQMKHSDVPKLRDKLLRRQKGICPICKNKIDAPCLDHQHIKRIKGTGQIRGVLCRSCNVLLGKLENNCVRYGVSQDRLPFVLRNMAEYLERPHFKYLHPSEAPPVKKLKKSSYTALVKRIKEKGSRKSPPPFPKSGKLTKPLKILYREHNLIPGFYK